MKNAIENDVIKTEKLNANNTNVDSIEKNVEEKNRKILDLLTVILYLYAITMKYMQWKKTDVTVLLELLMLFYLYYFLCKAYNASIMIAQLICDNLNLFDSSLTNSSKFGIKREISINTTNL